MEIDLMITGLMVMALGLITILVPLGLTLVAHGHDHLLLGLMRTGIAITVASYAFVLIVAAYMGIGLMR